MDSLLHSIKRKRALAGLAAALLCFTACMFVGGSLVKSAALALCFVIAGCIRIQIPKAFRIPVTAIALVAAGVAALFLTQFVQNEGMASLREGMALWGLCCCTILACALYLVIPDIRFSVIATTGLTLLLATANWFVFRFRGSELVPIDIISVGTAMNVANEYDFTITTNMVYAWVLFALMVFGVFSIQISQPGRKSSGYLAILGAAGALCMVFSFGTRNMVAFHFGNGGTYYNGYILNFTLSIKELFVGPPEGYSHESVAQIMGEYMESEEGVQTARPNIIVIMDEAYSDLSVLGDNFITSEPVSPFIHSLEKDTVKGYAMSSAYGGRTANSEFEFLTGATLGFVPQGTVGYQQYVKKDIISMASVLKARGYDTMAMHPFLANGWARNTAWPRLGFEKCYFLDDFPQEDLMRGFVSDQKMMEFIIRTIEQQDPETPLFLFGVTMQNHSAYDYQGDDFEESVFVKGYSQEYPAANQYLTLIHETDKATEHLINYLSTLDRETLVVFFGDHLPALNTALYEEIHGGSFDTMDEQMRHYKVPFFIWANFDIEERTVECTSLSYLSALTFEVAGMELTPYQRFLQDVQEVIPAINMEGYYSVEEDCFQMIGAAQGAEETWLNRYWQIQHAYLFDEVDPAFYGIAARSTSGEQYEPD